MAAAVEHFALAAATETNNSLLVATDIRLAFGFQLGPG